MPEEVTIPIPTTSGYAIEKGVPIPAKRGDRWPFRQMQVGDSFVITKADLPPSGAHCLQAAARVAGMRCAYRQQPDRMTIRVWRIT